MIRARAPATVANVFTGFDILGFAIPDLYDEVTVQKNNGGVKILSIEGNDHIPLQTDKNTAGMALQAMTNDLNLDFGFDLEIHKGIPLGSGLGGSAASAVAAVTAANELLSEKLPLDSLMDFALAGESVASGGTAHGDNVAASLFGGLTMCVKDRNRFLVRQLPIPDVWVLLIHPHLVLKTSELRSILSPFLSIEQYVNQSMNLAMFVNSLHTQKMDDLSSSLEDLIIEPQRKSLIPHFDEMKKVAIASGAIGFSISGAGPTVFAWFEKRSDTENALSEIKNLNISYEYESYITRIEKNGSTIVTR